MSQNGMRVSYEKETRAYAAAHQHGLFTIDIIGASKKPGKFGTRMTVQGPILTQSEFRRLHKLALDILASRKKSKEKP